MEPLAVSGGERVEAREQAGLVLKRAQGPLPPIFQDWCVVYVCLILTCLLRGKWGDCG